MAVVVRAMMGRIVGMGIVGALASFAAGCGSAHDTVSGSPATDGGLSSSSTEGIGSDVATDASSTSSSSHSSSAASNGPIDGGAAAPDGASGDAGTWWQPAPGVTWQWQLDGTLDTTLDVQMYDIDMFTNDATTIASLESRGIVVICYVDVGTWEPDRPDSASFPASVKGNPDPDGDGEYWLDIRSSTVQSIMQARFVTAQQKGCGGIEPDNVDGYENDTGFPLTGADQITYNTWVADAVHALGMSVALKNDTDQIQQLEPLFDFELDEQCFDYDECNTLLPFIQANKAALEVEYGDAGLAATICPQANAMKLDTIIKDMDLDAFRVSCH